MIKTVSVVLPTYNEKNTLEKTINSILALEKTIKDWKIQIVVSDSQSPDGTAELAEKLANSHKNIHVITVERGIGVGLIKGHQYALEHLKPDALVQIDADGQVDASLIPDLLKVLNDGYDLAIGSRFVPGGVNELPLDRRIYSVGSSLFCRILLGPFDIKEYSNSARAFTPKLFRQIDLDRIPWKERTFIIQPAFLYVAVASGAKYKEVPLKFMNRSADESKMMTYSYIYDIICFAIEARLREWGIQLPIFKWSRKMQLFLKFGLVGFSGTIIDFVFYKIFINYFGLPPATAKALSTEVAIFNNFLLNNYWTFKHRQTKNKLWQRFLIFNTVSFGGLAIAVLVIKFLDDTYGSGSLNILGLNIAYNNLYFLATVLPVMTWNFTVNHFITWRNKPNIKLDHH